MTYDTILYNSIVITVDAAFDVYQGGAVAIADGRIRKVWQPHAGEPLPSAGETIDACGGIVMPGLVNLHTHLPMSLFRGLADDLPLQQWLEDHIFPAEAVHIDPVSVRLGARLSCAEMLLGGTTTCCDGYFLADDVAASVVAMGMRAVVGQGVIDFPAPGVPDPSRNIDVAGDFARKWSGRSELVRPAIFCHAPYTCSDQTLIKAKETAESLGVLFQIHAAETRSELDQMQASHGCSVVAYLHGLGILNARTLLIHAIWVDARDIEQIAASGAPIAHCPESNMKLGSGVAPVPDFLKAGITVGIGTDGCASNNDLDLWGEMDTLAKLHKVQRLDPTVMDAATVVRMATMGGAEALGMADEIGSLELGKQADLIVIDVDQPHLTPIYHPASHLVYAVRAGDVRHVMVGGKWAVRERRLVRFDLDGLLAEGIRFAEKVKKIKGRK